MKTFILTEQQLGELSGRINAITVRGQDCEHVFMLNRLLQEIVAAADKAAADEAQSNIIPMDRAAE